MNILDENVPELQIALLRQVGIRARQIGRDVGRAGMQDEEIVALLHGSHRATFFTRDRDFADPRLMHSAYCLVYLDCDDNQVAEFLRRALRHPALSTFAKRVGTVVRVSDAGLRIVRWNAIEEVLSWPTR